MTTLYLIGAKTPRIVDTSTNHLEIIVLYETSRECVWLHRMTNHIQTSCSMGSIESPIVIYEDNAASVAHMQTRYIKSNVTKHITPKLFYPHQLQQSGEISILQIKNMIILLIYSQTIYLLPNLINVLRNWYASTKRFASFRAVSL